MSDQMHASLQENLITIVAFDEANGRVVANIIDPNLMEGDYRLIAERCIDYWRQYKLPPGEHLGDLFSDIIEDKHNRRAKSVQRIMTQMVQLREGLNTEFVLTQLRTFQRMQRIKGAIITSADKINANQQLAIAEVEDIWHGILKTQEMDFEPGLKLSEYARVVDRLEKLQSEFSMGIKILDDRNIRPIRGSLMILLGAAGRGKTWGLVHVGAEALAMRHRVVHVTLEMDEEFIAQRYYQTMFGVTKREKDVEITTMSIDMGKLEGLERAVIKPNFKWENSALLRDELWSHMNHMGLKRFDNLIIKRFKPNSLTPAGLRAYLDTLETVEGFVPDMIIVDYLGIMKIDLKNVRGSMGQNAIELRAIGIERNAAMITGHQASKAGEMATMIDATHMSEDWSVVGTADFVLTYSCTKLEFRYGLARLFVAKARGESDRFAVLITQAYKMGAFCIESHYLDPSYFDYLKEFEESPEEYDSPDDE